MRVSNQILLLLFTCTCAALALPGCDVKVSSSFPEEIAPFIGTFKGTTAAVAKGEISERDLVVTIKPWEKKGFTVEWSTVIYRANGEQKKSTPSINFYRSSRAGIYASAMRTNVFGHAVSYDPVDEGANPYVWAGLEEQTLTVTALYVLDGGGHEIHVYQRALHDEGLALDFERIRNGEIVTQVTAVLKPADP